jgi:hypothetical protein
MATALALIPKACAGTACRSRLGNLARKSKTLAYRSKLTLTISLIWASSAGSNGTSLIDKAWTFRDVVAGVGPHDHTGLPAFGFGAHTTLGYSEDSGDAGGTRPDRDGTHGAKLALLGHYMAASFVTAADGHGGSSSRRRRKRRTI